MEESISKRAERKKERENNEFERRSVSPIATSMCPLCKNTLVVSDKTDIYNHMGRCFIYNENLDKNTTLEELRVCIGPDSVKKRKSDPLEKSNTPITSPINIDVSPAVSPAVSPKIIIPAEQQQFEEEKAKFPLPNFNYTTPIVDQATASNSTDTTAPITTSITNTEPNSTVKQGIDVSKIDFKRSKKKNTSSDKTVRSCEADGCDQKVSQKQDNVIVVIGESYFYYCGSPHFCDAPCKSVLKTKVDRALLGYCPNNFNSDCQRNGCKAKIVDSNIRIISAKKNPGIDTVFRPLYFCTTNCLIEFLGVNSTNKKWVEVIKNLKPVPTSSIPAVKININK